MYATDNTPKSSHEPLGVYIHIPFCKSKCPYCDFCSYPHPSAETVTAYVSRLIESIRTQAASFASPPVDTVYFGGGTPTLLSPSDAERLLEAVFSSFSVLPDAEITLECNPGTADLSLLSLWRQGGANRLSMGAQSAHTNELKALGRMHSWEDVCRTVQHARAAGFDNINLDFMMGIPEQTKASLLETLQKAVALSPAHLSSYCLILEEDTPFGRRGAAALGIPDDDGMADLYEAAAEYLVACGYEHYEISNFSLPDKRSRHNLHTWQGREYLGLGIAAHGFVNGVRYANSRDLSAFLRGDSVWEDTYAVTPKEAAEEAIMLGLRLSDGIDTREIAQRTGVFFPPAFTNLCDRLEKVGLLTRHGTRISLTRKGFLLSNQIIGALISEVL